jgi:hypothetical protein
MRIRGDNVDFFLVARRHSGGRRRSGSEDLCGRIENGRNRMFESLGVMATSDSMGISWMVVKRRSRADWFDVTLKNGRRTRVPGRSVNRRTRNKKEKRTDTEVGDEGMEVGERGISWEFLLEEEILELGERLEAEVKCLRSTEGDMEAVDGVRLGQTESGRLRTRIRACAFCVCRHRVKSPSTSTIVALAVTMSCHATHKTGYLDGLAASLSVILSSNPISIQSTATRHSMVTKREKNKKR